MTSYYCAIYLKLGRIFVSLGNIPIGIKRMLVTRVSLCTDIMYRTLHFCNSVIANVQWNVKECLLLITDCVMKPFFYLNVLRSEKGIRWGLGFAYIFVWENVWNFMHTGDWDSSRKNNRNDNSQNLGWEKGPTFKTLWKSWKSGDSRCCRELI